MLRNHWLRSLAARFAHRFALRGWRRTRFHAGSRQHGRLSFERLEERTLLATLTVNSLADNVIGGNALVTLREAINAAINDAVTDLGQTGSGADTIVFQAGLNGEIDLTLGALGGGINQNITITGNGAANTAIDAQLASRVFAFGTSAGADIRLDGLTIKNGRHAGTYGGGGVYFYGGQGGDLTIANSTITNNATTAGQDGGGVYFRETGTLTITNSTLSGNFTTGNNATGGGAYVYGGNANITNSTFSGNYTQGQNSHSGGLHIQSNGSVQTINVTNSRFTGNNTQDGTSYAGAIGQYGNAGANSAINITNSTISGNSAGASGGGISTYNMAVVLRGSTVSGNSSNGLGGGGGVFSAGGNLGVLNSTISGNQAVYGGGIDMSTAGAGSYALIYGSTITANSAQVGGGIRTNLAPGTVALAISNSIVAGNTAVNAPGIDFFAPGGGLAVNNSLIGRSDSTTLASTGGAIGANGNIVGGTTVGTAVNPLLGALADNGGPTLTHALLAGSLAINTGNNSLIAGATSDQRGSPFYRIFGGTVDMGAFEAQALSITGNTATLTGTAGIDSFTYNVATRVVRFGTLPYVLPANINLVNFDGLAGKDLLSLLGTAGANNAQVTQGGVNFEHDASHAGFDAVGANLETILLFGQGGADTVTFTGSAGDDKFFARATSGFMLNTTHDLEAFAFAQMTGNLLGGNDLARFFDTPGNETVTAGSAAATISGAGFLHTASGYETLLALSTAGGNDTANLTGTAGDENFAGGLGTANLGGVGFSLQMLSFETVNINGVSGLDIARFTGSAGDDVFTSNPTGGQFTGPGFNLVTSNFDRHFATAGAGNDTANLTDSVGNDTFTGVGNEGTLSGTGFIQRATGFDTVNIFGINGGTNTLAITNPLAFNLVQIGIWT